LSVFVGLILFVRVWEIANSKWQQNVQTIDNLFRYAE